MSDIVERLRSVGRDYDFHENAYIYEAANEIERLREALREYADRLQKGADHVVHYSLMETPRKLPNIATVVEISAGHLRDIAKDMLDAATA